ncbi:MAG: DUF3431 domain-containing protein, partial [Pseudomonadota bacterium]
YFKWLDKNLPKTNDDSKSFEVVIVRFNEDLSWALKELKYENVTIYNKGKNDLIELPANFKIENIPNLGWFGGTIFYHLANKYNALADRTLFLQGNPYQQHAFLPLIRYKEDLPTKCNNIIAKCSETTLEAMSAMLASHSQENWEKSKYGKNFKLPNYTTTEYAHTYIGADIELKAPLGMVWGAQFAVDKDKVHKRKQDYYIKRLPIFNETYPIADFCQEKLWDKEFEEHIIFNFSAERAKESLEKQIKISGVSQLNSQLFDNSFYGNNDAIIELLSKGADINSRHTDLLATPLYAATKNNQLATVKLLHKNKADINIPASNGASPLYIAATNNYPEITQFLIDSGADQFTKVDALIPFSGSVYFGKLNTTKVFLNSGANVLSDDLRSPLYVASKLRNDSAEHKEIHDLIMNEYRRIRDSKPSFEAVIVRYSEDLHWVEEEFPNEKVIIYNKGEDDLDYLPKNCEIRKIPNIGWLGGTYLYHFEKYYEKIADKTLLLQANPYDTEAFLPLRRYKGEVKSICSDIVAKCENTTLAHQSSRLEAATEEDWQAKYSCFEPVNYTMIEFFHKYIDRTITPEDPLDMDLGAQFAVTKEQVHYHPRSYYGRMLPEFNKKCPRADFYLEKAWNHIFKKPNSAKLNTALLNAAFYGNNEAVEDLVAQGAEVNSIHTELEVTPLYAAARHNQASTLELLMRLGADVNAISKTSGTALYTAAHHCYPDIIKILLENNADVELTNKDTPIYGAIVNKCKKGVELLLNANATIYSDMVSPYREVRIPLSLSAFLNNREDGGQTTEEIYNMTLNHYWKTYEEQIQDLTELYKNISFEIVIVRYKENLGWATKEFLYDKVTVYNKGPDDIGELPTNFEIKKVNNTGYLGGSYYKHIVDNYETLADRVLFLQGDPLDSNIFLPLIRYKGDLPSKCHNIIGKCVNRTLRGEIDFLKTLDWSNIPRYKDFEPRNFDAINFTNKSAPNLTLDEDLWMVVGANFAVDTKKIYNHPKEEYEAMLSYFDHIKPMADHYAERLWDARFDGIGEGAFYGHNDY